MRLYISKLEFVGRPLKYLWEVFFPKHFFHVTPKNPARVIEKGALFNILTLLIKKKMFITEDRG